MPEYAGPPVRPLPSGNPSQCQSQRQRYEHYWAIPSRTVELFGASNLAYPTFGHNSVVDFGIPELLDPEVFTALLDNYCLEDFEWDRHGFLFQRRHGFVPDSFISGGIEELVPFPSK